MQKLKTWLNIIYVKIQKVFLFIGLTKKLLTFVNFIQRYQKKFYLSNLYTNCFDITLKTYIDVVVNENYKKLRKRAIYVPKKYYYEALVKIQEHHIEITENKQVKNEKTKKDKQDKLSSKKFELVCLFFILKNKDSDFAMSELKRKGYTAKDKEQMLKKIEAGVKMINMELNMLSSNKDDENYTEQTTKDFYDTLTILSKNGYSVSDNMSYGHYIITINTFNKEIESLKNGKRNRPS